MKSCHYDIYCRSHQRVFQSYHVHTKHPLKMQHLPHFAVYVLILQPRLNHGLSGAFLGKNYSTIFFQWIFWLKIYQVWGPDQVFHDQDVNENSFFSDNFRNRLFVLYCCAMGLGNNGIVNACIFLPPRAIDLGVNKSEAAMLLSIVGGCDFVGRISGGYFADLG